MVWSKAIGTILIISCFGFWGLSGARRIGRRTEQLKDLRFAIAFLEKEIIYMHTPLTLAFKRTADASKEPIAVLFRESSQILQQGTGITAAEAWLTAAQNLQAETDLNNKDLDIIESAAHHLGMSDVSQHQQVLSLVQEKLKIQEEKARQEQAANQKLWSYGGFILGSVIVLLLI
jgi:stage III sporulation protein AB